MMEGGLPVDVSPAAGVGSALGWSDHDPSMLIQDRAHGAPAAIPGGIGELEAHTEIRFFLRGRTAMRDGGDAAPSPAALAAAALRTRLSKLPSKAAMVPDVYPGGRQDGGKDPEVLKTRIRRVQKFKSMEPVSKPAPGMVKTRITKGIPKSEWSTLLHSTKCNHDPKPGDVACKLEPNFGDPKEGRAAFCRSHKLPGHVDVRLRGVCEVPNCKRYRLFGDRNADAARFCAEHKMAHHVDIVNRRCKLPDGCDKQASFGDERDKIPLYCVAHKLVGHTNVRRKTCKFEGCTSHSSFGEINGPAEWCALHRSARMVNRVSKLCKYPHGCLRSPSFGSAADKKVSFCSLHRGPNDVNLRLNRGKPLQHTCKREGCVVKPIFGDAVRRVAEFCRRHSPPGSVDLANRLCEGGNCTRRALFAPLPAAEGSTDAGGWGKRVRPVFCAKHRGAAQTPQRWPWFLKSTDISGGFHAAHWCAVLCFLCVPRGRGRRR